MKTRTESLKEKGLELLKMAPRENKVGIHTIEYILLMLKKNQAKGVSSYDKDVIAWDMFDNKVIGKVPYEVTHYREFCIAHGEIVPSSKIEDLLSESVLDIEFTAEYVLLRICGEEETIILKVKRDMKYLVAFLKRILTNELFDIHQKQICTSNIYVLERSLQEKLAYHQQIVTEIEKKLRNLKDLTEPKEVMEVKNEN